MPGIDAPMEFVLPETREVFRNLGSQIPEDLEPYAERARKRLSDVKLLPSDKVIEGIKRKQLDIREKKLQAERGHISALLREGAIDTEEAARLLDDVRRGIEDVARELSPERESAGSR